MAEQQQPRFRTQVPAYVARTAMSAEERERDEQRRIEEKYAGWEPWEDATWD